MTKKLLVIYPEYKMNGVKRLILDLYTPDAKEFEGYEIRRLGIWFDETLKDENEMIKAKTKGEKQQLKRKTLKIIEEFDPDIIHFHAYAIDWEILEEIFERYREKTIYTVHSISIDETLISSGINASDECKKEVIKLSRKYFELSEDEKIEEERKILRKYNIDIPIENFNILVYMQALQTYLLENSKEIVYVSSFVKERVKDFFGIERGIVIENGTRLFEIYERDKEKIKRSANKWRSENPDLFDVDLLITYVGRVTPQKGIEDLLYLAKWLPENIKILLAGNIEESYLEELQKLAKKLEIPHRKILYIEEPDDFQLLTIYEASDIIIYPSHYEPFGLVPIEAVSLGKPVIVRNVDNLRSFVEEHIAYGYSYDFELPETVRRVLFDLINNKDKFEKVKSYVREKYVIRRVRNEYSKVYEKLTNSV